MINTNMREYSYFTFGTSNGYRQPQLSKEPKGKVKLSIFLTSEIIQDNINYKDANYVAFTLSSLLDDNCVVACGEEKLKVLYVNPFGRYKQVFLKRI